MTPWACIWGLAVTVTTAHTNGKQRCSACQHKPGRVLPAQIFPNYSISLEMWHLRYSRLFVFHELFSEWRMLHGQPGIWTREGPLHISLTFTCCLDRSHPLVWTPPDQLLWSQPVVWSLRKAAALVEFTPRGPLNFGDKSPPSIFCSFHRSLPSMPGVPTSDWEIWIPILI